MRRHVLVARLDNTGDVLLSGPAVRAVAASGARVTYLCGPKGEAAARLLPGVDEVIVHRAEWIDPDPPPVSAPRLLELVERLRSARLDEAVVMTSFHQSALPAALLLRLAGVPTIAAISEDYPGSLLDVRHRVDDDIHEVRRGLSLVATLGHRLPAGDDERLRIVLPEPAAADGPPADGGPAEGVVAEGAPVEPGGCVVVHPGASVPARAWAPDRMAEVTAALVRAGRRVVVTGGPGEEGLTAAVAGSAGVDLGASTTLAELACVLRGADVLVSGNSGPAHLAAAVGTPVVSLYAPTVPAVRWRPWMVPHVLLGDQRIACAGCRARLCPVPGHPCLGAVSTDEVLQAVALLSERTEVAA